MKTPCPESILDQFSDYYDDELSPNERASFEAFLDQHPECCDEYDAFAESLEMMHDLQHLFAPKNLVHDVTKKVNRQLHQAKHRHGSFRIPYEVFALLVLISVVSLFVLDQAPKRAQPQLSKLPGFFENMEPSAALPIRLAPGTDLNVLRQKLIKGGWRVLRKFPEEGGAQIYVVLRPGDAGAFTDALSAFARQPVQRVDEHSKTVILRLGVSE